MALAYTPTIHLASPRGGIAPRTKGVSTKCSARNQTCSSFGRITSPTNMSFVPSSPDCEACLAINRGLQRNLVSLQ